MSTRNPSEPGRPKPFASWRGAAAWLAVVLGIGLLMFTYHHLSVLAEGGTRPVSVALINELTAAFGAGVLFLGVWHLVRRLPLVHGAVLKRLSAYAAGLAIYSVLHTSSNWALRSLLYPIAGLGGYDYGKMPLRYLMELPIDVLGFVMMVGVLHGVRRLRAARERELAAVRLEGALARTQLRNLRLQLQPHFLFNALNTVSATMYDAPETADEILDGIGELLRASLRTTATDTVPLTTELELLDAYLRIVRARFGDRAHIVLDVEPGLGGARVPPLLLQPLVENAVRHGGAETRGRVEVRVRVARAQDRLAIEVTDDGPGPQPDAEPLNAGLGLSTTAERLRLLYGERCRFDAGAGTAGGFRVAVELPFQAAG